MAEEAPHNLALRTTCTTCQATHNGGAACTVAGSDWTSTCSSRAKPLKKSSMKWENDGSNWGFNRERQVECNK